MTRRCISATIIIPYQPNYIDVSLGGYHQDFVLQQNSCLPQAGQNVVTIPLIWCISEDGGINHSTLSMPIDRVTFSTTKYVNANPAIPWNQIANWSVHNGRWDDESLEGDGSTEKGFTVLAVLRYSGNITQSVYRTLSVKCAVRYQVNLQVNVGPVPVVLTTGEYSLSPIITVYPHPSY